MQSERASESGKPILEYVPCDFCGSDDSTLLYELTDTLYGSPGLFPVRRCRVCKLIYLNPRPTADALLAHYPPSYESHQPPTILGSASLAGIGRRLNLAQKRGLVVRHISGATGTLLDVGCATGIFLNEMHRAGWEVKGVEPAAEAAEVARITFGLNVLTGTLEPGMFPPSSFDVVTYWDTLEHTPSPIAQLQTTFTLLKPGGVAILKVPNWDGIDRHIFGGAWHGFDVPRHLYVFPRGVIASRLSGLGFEVRRIIGGPAGYYSLTLSAYRVLRGARVAGARRILGLLQTPGMRVLVQPILTLLDAVRRGPALTFLAKKPPSRT